MNSLRDLVIRTVVASVLLIAGGVCRMPVNCEQIAATKLGPLSLGMSLPDAQAALGASGFPGLRDALVDLTGRTFIGPSSQAFAGLTFKRTNGKLVSLSVCSRKKEVRARERAADSAGFYDWRSDFEFENWSVAEGFRLGDSLDEVFHACEIDPVEGAEVTQRLLIIYENPTADGVVTGPLDRSDFVFSSGLWQKLGRLKETGQNYLVVAGKNDSYPHTLRVEFEEGKAVSICLYNQ